MKISDDIKLDFDDVLIRPKRSVVASRSEVKLERIFNFYHSDRQWLGFPIFASNMYCTGSMEMAKALHNFQACTVLHKFYKVNELEDFFLNNSGQHAYYDTWLSIGIKDEELNTICDLKKILDGKVKFPNICIDVANGYSQAFVDHCKIIRDIFKDSIIMAGNVCTPEMVEELIIHGGVDIVKIGIGPGAQCETRKMTGVGIPQLSAILECVDAAHGLKSGEKKNGLICADGGIKTPGDLCKVFGAGADFAMLGTYLAGSDECLGNRDRERKLEFYGMSSALAQQTHGNGVPEYAVSEGKTTWVDYKGPVEDLIKQLQGGLRSCCSYINCSSLKDMAKCTSFVRI